MALYFYLLTLYANLTGMPLFGQKRNSHGERKKAGAGAPNGMPTETLAQLEAAPNLPPPPIPEASQVAVAKTHNQSVIPSRKELLFHSQLAHGSATKEIKDFSNVKELYQKITESFGLGPNEVRDD